MNELRLFKGGKLRFNKINNEEYCPQDPTKVVKTGNETQVVIAFLAGYFKYIHIIIITVIKAFFIYHIKYKSKQYGKAHYYYTPFIIP